MYKSILVGTDGSDTAEAAVDVALELAERFGSTVRVVNVYKPVATGLHVPEMSMAYPEGIDLGDVAQTLADSVAAKARARGLEASTHVVAGDAVTQIIAAAEEQGVDLIVVGNKRMHGLKRVLGSIPNGVAHKAPCAVLIVKTT